VKTILLFMIVFFSGHSMLAQTKQVMKKDTLSLEIKKKPPLNSRKTVVDKDLKSEITDQLQKVLQRHADFPNEEATWKQIRSEATDILLTYFKNGKLFRSQPSVAFYVSIGPETMTSTDISNHRMILVAGVAIVKPAEFEIIRISHP
jgi:phage tail sheath protein FI